MLLAEDLLLLVTDDASGRLTADGVQIDADDLLGAGLFQWPSRAQAVAALAAARREVASCQARGESVMEWLAGEIHCRGIRENAAVLAVLEIPEYRHQAAQAYALDHPGHLRALEDMLASLT
jgi:hypothetical protein